MRCSTLLDCKLFVFFVSLDLPILVMESALCQFCEAKRQASKTQYKALRGSGSRDMAARTEPHFPEDCATFGVAANGQDLLIKGTSTDRGELPCERDLGVWTSACPANAAKTKSNEDGNKRSEANGRLDHVVSVSLAYVRGIPRHLERHK